MLEMLIFIGGIVILVLVLNLRGRVQRLEQLVKTGSAETASPGPALQTELQPISQPPSVAVPTGPTWFDKFMAWLKEDWILKLGALLLIIGFGWLASYAFLNNWIGPMGRIALGVIAGALFLVLGWWRIKTFLHQGGIFLVLGSTTILLTLFAAREIYDFFTPLSTLIVMFLSTAFVAVTSVKYRNWPLAISSLILAGIAPLFTNSPVPNYPGLFLYLFVVILGTIWMVAVTGRRELTAAALILVVFYSLPHLLSFVSADKETLLLFVYAFSAVFFLTNCLGIIKLKGKQIAPDLVTAAGTGMFLLIWIMTAAQKEWQSLIISAWMVVFAAGAFLIFRITQRREPFYAYAGVCIVMLAAATSAELSGATLTMAYTIEAAAIVLITHRLLQDLRATAKVSLLLIGPAILSLQSITSPAWYQAVIHKDFFVLLILTLALGGVGAFFYDQAKRLNDVEKNELTRFAWVFLVGSSIYAYVLLWLSLHAALLDDDTAVMIALVIYTIIGLAVYFSGVSGAQKPLRIYGGTLVGFVMGRLLLVDVWKMALTGRIITFFLVGAILMSTAFLGRKKTI